MKRLLATAIAVVAAALILAPIAFSGGNHPEPPKPRPNCPEGTTKIGDYPLVCLKTETKEVVREVIKWRDNEEKIYITQWGAPKPCESPAVETAKGDGWVQCTIVTPPTVIEKKVPGPVRRIVKWKKSPPKKVVVVKWKTRICPRPKPCPPYHVKLWDAKAKTWVCAPEGNG